MNAVGQNLNATHYQSNLMSWVISNAVLEAAFAEVVKSREHDSHNTNIWWLRRNWPAQKQALRDSLLNSIDRLSLLKRKSLDQTAPPDCATARYMDDGIIFVKTRWQLWRVIKNMHEVVHGLKLKLDLDKTFIGRIHKGVDFVGYRFNASGLCGLVQRTIDHHWNKRLRLDEQSASDQRGQAWTSPNHGSPLPHHKHILTAPTTRRATTLYDDLLLQRPQP